MSNLDPRDQQSIAEGEAAWRKVSSGNWDESVWMTIGTALTLLRREVLFDLKTNVARGSIYNTAFAKRLDGTAFKTMAPVTRSNLLYVMEPANLSVLYRVLAKWTPEQRARRTHPTTLAKAIREALAPPPPPPQPVKPAVKPNGDAARYEAEIAKLKEENAALKSETAVPLKDLDKLSREHLYREVFKARMESDRLRAQLAETRKSEPDQIAKLRRQVEGLEEQHARRDNAAKAQQTKAAKAAKALAEGGEDPRLAQLQKTNSTLRRKINEMERQHNNAARMNGHMSFPTVAAISKVLNANTSPEGLAALKAFNAWKADNNNAGKADNKAVRHK